MWRHQTRRSRQSLLAAGLAVLGALGVTACTAGSTGAPGPGFSSPGLTSQPADSSGGTTPAETPSPDSNPNHTCASGRVEVFYRMGAPQPAELCVHIGTEIVITLRGAPGYKWTPVRSSDLAVVSVTATLTTEGVASATGNALTPGHAELRSTVSFTGDPFGPPTLLWRLAVRVIP
jgi:hypothetical protein